MIQQEKRLMPAMDGGLFKKHFKQKKIANFY